MSMISFVFFGFVVLLCFLLYGVNIMIKDTRRSTVISNRILLIASYVFIVCGSWKYALVCAGITLTTWFCSRRKKLIPFGIVIPVLALVFFKYTDFLGKTLYDLLSKDYTALHLLLPLGLSFYSFSAIGYLVDVYREKIKPQRFEDVAFYLAFFPKLTSGPIQSSRSFFQQAYSYRKISWVNISCGVQIFVFGLFKKMVLADRLNVFVSQVYDTPEAFGSLTVAMAVVAYSLQIYFDFSGYSDMAIGVGKMLGFDLPRNFNLPYLSHNVTEFWKRWHITLSSWLQEYLYISLGGNRKGKVRTYINLILTMVIGGIWHGANWTFILWGLLHGLALAVHKIWMKLTRADTKKPSSVGSALSIIGTFCFISIAWVFFRAQSVSEAITVLCRIVKCTQGVEQPYMWLFVSGIVLVIGSVVAYVKSRGQEVSLKKKNVSLVNGYYPLVKLDSLWGLVAFFVFVLLLVCLAYTGGSPFIYGNF